MAKTPTPVDRKLLTESIEIVEDRHKPTTLGELFELVAEEYNSNKSDNYKSIKWSTVRSRVVEWGLQLKTSGGKGKGKPSAKVDKQRLVTCINRAEEDGPRANRQQLYNAVTDLYNNSDDIEQNITPSIALLRIKEWNIPVKTPLGKRGREKQVQVFKGLFQDFTELLDGFYDQRCPFEVVYSGDDVVVKVPESHSNVLEAQTV